MIIAETALLSVLSVLGYYSAYTDIRTGLIPNRYLLIGLLSGLPAHTAILLLGGSVFYPSWLINMIIADILAFILYAGKIWAAGDAKLFMTLYFLLPPPLLDMGTTVHSIVPFVFIFLPGLFWVIVDSFLKLLRKEPRKSKPFNLKNILITYCRIVIETTGIYCLVSFFAGSLIEENRFLFSLLLIMYAYFCSSNRFMKKWYIVLMHLSIQILFCALGKWTISFPNWQSLILIISLMIIQQFASMYNYQFIPTSETKQGMIPAMESVLLFQKSRIRSLPKDASEELTAKMTAEEADAVKRWGETANGTHSIWIVRKTPFAIMISLGFTAWIIVRIVR